MPPKESLFSTLRKTVVFFRLTRTYLRDAAVADARERTDLRIQQLMLVQQHGGIGSQPALQIRTTGLAMADMKLETQGHPFTPIRSPL